MIRPRVLPPHKPPRSCISRGQTLLLGKKSAGKMERAEKSAKVGGVGEGSGSGRLDLMDLLDEDRCRQKMVILIHGDSPVCPSCRAPIAPSGLPRFSSGGRVRCASCGKFFTALTGTAFEGFHGTWAEMVLVTYLIALGTANSDIAAILGRDPDTVRLRRKRIQTLGVSIA